MAINQELEPRPQFGDDQREHRVEQLLEQAYLLPRSPEELRLKRSGFFGLAEGSSAFANGWSDYAHSLLAGWYAHERYVRGEGENVEEEYTIGTTSSWKQLYWQSARQLSVITTSLHPIARHSGDHPIVRTDSDGLIRLNGRQTFGSDALLAEELLVFVREEGAAEPTTAALISKNAEGLQLLPVVSGVPTSTGGSVTALYEDVKIPQERLLIGQDAEGLKRLLSHPLTKSLADYQWASRQLEAIELIAGVAFALAEQTGHSGELHIQGELGELIQGIETLKALLHAAEIGAALSPAGVLLPALAPLQSARKAGGELYGTAVNVLQHIGAAAFLSDPSVSAAPSGDNGKPTLLQLAWQLAGSSDAAVTKLREQHAFGDPLLQSQELHRLYPVQRLRNRYLEFWQTVQSIDSDNDAEVRT
ncbi:4-hydroxyphenylacetate 3-monooxygenase [Paenibacillus cellulosilyticus]|uniref:4-hydroxyphenylacetate 3-monooxygenase n=1 Tax=Paenibacillus cellulosilyticus TaxID=375489 RepID=A0A2V2YQN4_9BACL|nr:4-hydroxyphenylacetate 3-hydroxylase C-terminal domain-containing protein [Paenibacillus cellulosilyticus]PWV99472.1 4-hydroxyphenylacetate 3-monooxygenase [Paenibacillus cellulosilyticus]QKS44728.1 hypothetical protein HUB94_10130 [Paenibacillus cellulosilyticus]